MQLSKNFTLSEFTESETADRQQIHNDPSAEEIDNIKSLVLNVMQPFRDYVGSPIVISSGFRSLKVNAIIGGSRNSQHTKGQAVDFKVLGMTPLQACHALVKSGIKFDQLIWESSWVHVSYNKDGNRGQVLTAHFRRGAPATYTNGLPASE